MWADCLHHPLLLGSTVYLYPCQQTTHFAALLKAAKSGHRRTVENLLKKGANINYQDEARQSIVCNAHMYIMLIVSFTLQDGVTPLYVASQEGNTEVVDTLLKNKADANIACTVRRLVFVFYLFKALFYIENMQCVCNCIMYSLLTGGL